MMKCKCTVAYAELYTYLQNIVKFYYNLLLSTVYALFIMINTAIFYVL